MIVFVLTLLAIREAAASYSCNVPSNEIGMRLHETTSPTPYDCLDNGCGNTCRGGQCVALITCRCYGAPGTNCWSPGAKVVNGGQCNTGIAPNTAIATFDAAGNYNGHAAVFTGCNGPYVNVIDQWCCRQIGYTTYTSAEWHWDDFYVIELRGGCGNRGSFPCRLEGGGSTCCDTYAPGCLKSRHWWSPDNE